MKIPNIMNDFDRALKLKKQLLEQIPGIEEKLTVVEMDQLIDCCYKAAMQELAEYGLLNIQDIDGFK